MADRAMKSRSWEFPSMETDAIDRRANDLNPLLTFLGTYFADSVGVEWIAMD
jgi:hypothetical protein